MPNGKRQSYKKHQLNTGRYPVKEGTIRLPKDCYWMVLKHLGGGDFTNERDATGNIALILSDDRGRGRGRTWPVISFLTTDEALHLAKSLEQYAKGEPYKPPKPKKSPKAELYNPDQTMGQLL